MTLDLTFFGKVFTFHKISVNSKELEFFCVEFDFDALHRILFDHISTPWVVYCFVQNFMVEEWQEINYIELQKLPKGMYIDREI